MPEKSTEKDVLTAETPVKTQFSRFLVQGLLLNAGKKGLSVTELKEMVKAEGVEVSRRRLYHTIEEMKQYLSPNMYLDATIQRVGPQRIPTQFFYITRYKSKK